MATDYYAILGVSRDATDAKLKKAFRKKAVELHPDHNPDDPAAEEEFKTVNEAYAVLSDAEKRASYVRFGAVGFSQQFSSEDIFRCTDFSDIFSNLGFGGDIFSAFGGRGGGQPRGNPMGGGFGGMGGRPQGAPPGQDISIDVELSFYESIFGSERGIGVNRNDGSRELTVKIPQGTTNGQRIRVRGEGQASMYQGGTRGDLYLRIRVHPDPQFTRNGNDLMVQSKAPISTLALGGKLKVATMNGHKTVKVAAGTASGSKIRIKNEGVPQKGGKRGNLYVTLLPDIPAELSDEQLELMEQLKELGL